MEFARSVVSRLRQYVGDRRHAHRQKVRLEFGIFVAGPAKNVNGSRQTRTLQGHTLDISPHGMSLIVPAIRIGEHHLVGEQREFGLNLELPDGPITMMVSPVRYESLEEHKTETGFLIGVRIVSIEEIDQSRFSAYVEALSERQVV
jgi:PilZ domain